jgi:tRNA (guanine-N7-)-methyltransferase
MGKDKLRRFAENLTFPNLIQPKIAFPPDDHPLKGKWKHDFFHNNNPIVLELGCGRGEYTINLAQKFPEKNFIGIDWKGARLWRGAKTAFEEKILNAGFLRIQIQNIASFFSADEVDEIWITFPDPQMEQSREQKRLTSKRFLDIYRKFLIDKGIINLKTDSFPFYEYSIGAIENDDGQILFKTEDIYHEHSSDEVLAIKTTYENKWLNAGSKICYLKYSLPH